MDDAMTTTTVSAHMANPSIEQEPIDPLESSQGRYVCSIF